MLVSSLGFPAEVPLKARFDIVVCGGSEQFAELRRLLPAVSPFGTVHLASSYLKPDQVDALRPWIDVLHEPRHNPDGYENFRLFCINDLNRIGSAPHFIKVDTDVELADDWIEYVEECLEASPDAVLFGTHQGSNKINYDISGPLVRHKLGGDVRVREQVKVNGSFYVGDTAFFREHDATMQILHDLIYAFQDGRRSRPSHLGVDLEEVPGAEALVRMRGVCALRAGKASEDNVRSLAVYQVGAGKRIVVRHPGDRIFVPDKASEPSPWKRRRKRLRSSLGISWTSTKKPEGSY